jgi:hypothetical protein
MKGLVESDKFSTRGEGEARPFLSQMGDDRKGRTAGGTQSGSAGDLVAGDFHSRKSKKPERSSHVEVPFRQGMTSLSAGRLRHFFQRGPQNGFLLGRHLQQIVPLRLDFLFHNGAEVLIQREEGVRFQFTERASQLLLDPVDGMKKEALVDVQLAAAKLPVGAQKEVITKQLVLEIVEIPFAYETKVRDVFFILSAPHRAP